MSSEITKLTFSECLLMDVELAHTVLQWRQKEQELEKKANELEVGIIITDPNKSRLTRQEIQHSIEGVIQSVYTVHSTRQKSLEQLKTDAQDLTARLTRVPGFVDSDEDIQDLTNTIEYHTTGYTNSQELQWRLETIMEEWEIARQGNDARRRAAEGVDKGQAGRW
jgi:phosphoglycerate-specific signal transduction histidine kinase